jgi:hypothetical protein
MFASSIRAVSRGFELEQAPHPRTQHETIVGLGKKIVAASFDRAHAVTRVVERGHEDHWNSRSARIALDPTTDLEPRRAIVNAQIASRHRHIQNAKVRLVLGCGRDSRGSVRRCNRVVAQTIQLIEQ